MDKPISFHDSVLVRVEREGARLRLVFGSVFVDGDLLDAVLVLVDVSKVWRDDVAVGEFVMEGADGEVLTLERTAITLFLVLAWCDYQPTRQMTRIYRFECGSVDLEIA